MYRRSIGMFVAIGAIALGVAVLPASPASAVCANHDTPLAEGATTGTAGDNNGTQGQLYVPTAGEYLVQSGGTTAGDVAVYSPIPQEQFQFGWYMGTVTTVGGIVTNTSPHLFAAQTLPYATGEQLYDVGAVSTGYHTFQVRRNETTGQYYGFLDGVQLWISPSAGNSGLVTTAAGENNGCSHIDARFANPTYLQPYKTLQAHHATTNTWSYWQEWHAFAPSGGCYVNSKYNNETPTERALGTCY